MTHILKQTLPFICGKILQKRRTKNFFLKEVVIRLETYNLNL